MEAGMVRIWKKRRPFLLPAILAFAVGLLLFLVIVLQM